MKLKDAKYFGVKLSEHRIKNDKGQLIVTGCEFARTGKQKYHSSELTPEGEVDKLNKFIFLDRPYEEVKDSKTVASFEACPVTEDHPEEDVKVGVNYDKLAKGFAKNVKFVDDVPGKEGHLEADFVITDQDLIDKIESGQIRELSAGYNCDVDEDTWKQSHIRGNHIAVVAQARAGHSACLRDSAYKSTSKKVKTLKIGDKLVNIADSYSYELQEEEGVVRYTDYYTETASGKKKFLCTLKDEDSKIEDEEAKIEDCDVLEMLKDRTNNFTKPFSGNIVVEEKDLDTAKEILKNYYYDVEYVHLNPTDYLYSPHPSGKRVKQYAIYGDTLKKDIKDNKAQDCDILMKDSSEDQIIATRRKVDEEIRDLFEDNPAFDIEGFYNGLDSTEGSIYTVWYSRKKDTDPNKPSRKDFDDFDDYLDGLCEYLEDKYLEDLERIEEVETVDIGVADYDRSEEYNINFHIYCRDVSK